MARDVIEEKVVHHAQHLYLIYSQSRTLNNLILNAPWPFIDGSHTNPRHHIDGVVGSTSSAIVGQQTRKFGQITIASNPSPTTVVTNSTLAHVEAFKVNIVQMTSSKNLQQHERKTKNKNKYKKYSCQQSNQQAQQPTTKETKNKSKLKYPCMICKEDNLIIDFPYLGNIHQYIQ